ncbi:AAA family ATPase [Streptomyces mirabilis]|uniref:AAA family ATPase n=1 Tax=Streptomyces mirabilis TaxID=68239 RepID=UPI00371641AF
MRAGCAAEAEGSPKASRVGAWPIRPRGGTESGRLERRSIPADGGGARVKAEVSGETAGPVVYLLVGLTGSGKTTYAQRRLEPVGAVRLSVDERVHARYGRYGADYPERDYFALRSARNWSA